MRQICLPIIYKTHLNIFTDMYIGVSIEIDDDRNDDWRQRRRVVELEKMAGEMFCDMCNSWLHLKDISKAAHFSLGSMLHIKCISCWTVKRLFVGKRNDDGGFDVNRKAFIG